VKRRDEEGFDGDVVVMLKEVLMVMTRMVMMDGWVVKGCRG
jgi:hypothetical protein